MAKQLEPMEAKAHAYVASLPPVGPVTILDSQHLAFEDFIAGYRANQADLAFCIKQLQQLLDVAGRESECYSASIARYTLHALGALEQP